MYHKSSSNRSAIGLIYISFLVVELAIAAPLDIKTSSFYGSNSNLFESSPSSSSQLSTSISLNDKQPAKSEISETVSKILRLMHSLSNKSILVTPGGSSTGNLAAHQSTNYNLNEVKRDSNLKFKSFVESKTDENNRKLSERFNKFNLKKMSENKLINENLNDETATVNDRSVNNENYKEENGSTDQSNESNDNNLFTRDRLIQSPLNREYTLSAKYPSSVDEQQQTDQKVTTNSDSIRFNSMHKFNEMIRQTDSNTDDESARSPINNLSAFIKQFSRLNEQIEQDNRASKETIKPIDNEQLERFEVQLTKDHKKNLYDMVENEEEDNQGEEEHNMHNYNISLLSDRELNRTLIDIQWLLDQNLSKQEMESKFSAKGRNNRNKIAQRMEYFDKLYRNIHQLSSNTPTNVKRGEGPQLSVVSPLDILRDKLILEHARRKIEQSKSQMKQNDLYLQKIG